MKQTQIFTQTNLTLLMLAVLLAGALLFAGCATGGGDTSEAAAHPASCH